MQQNPTNFFESTQKYSIQEVCLKELSRCRRKDGFICSKCSHDKSYQLKYRHLHECAKSGRQVSPTAGTVFEHTRWPLPKWFAEICLMGAAEKGWISTQRLSKMIGVSWPTAYRKLRILHQCMGDRDRGYWLEGLVEVDDVFVGGRKSGNRGRGTKGKKPLIFALEQSENGMGFIAARLLERMDSEQVREFTKRISPFSEIRKDALKALRYLGESHRYLQEYIDEFVFRFNCRFWEPQLPDRLLQAAVDHVPIRASFNSV